MTHDRLAPAPDSLTELIWGQSMAGIAVPVLLSGPGDVIDGTAPFTAEAYAEQCRLGVEVIEGRRAPSGILAVNFHELRAENRAEARRLLTALATVGPAWTPAAADGASKGGQIFVGFYDGYRDTAMWGADVCDELGLQAHFFPIFTPEFPGEAGLDDADLAALSERHVIGFHTDSHQFVADVNADTVEAEVRAPIARIAAATGRPTLIGAWCGGTRFDPRVIGNQVLARSGVRYLISNWSIEAVPTAD